MLECIDEDHNLPVILLDHAGPKHGVHRVIQFDDRLVQIDSWVEAHRKNFLHQADLIHRALRQQRISQLLPCIHSRR